MSKSQNIVLKHLYLLLGYSQSEKALYMAAQKVRSSAVFSAYLSNLPQLLDQNHLMGWMLLNTSLVLLQWSPCPHTSPSADGNQQADASNILLDNGQQPSYSLWSLEPHLRHCWLMSLVVLLYKYQYNQPPHCHSLQHLVHIVLNTLDSQHHHCRRIPATIVMGALSGGNGGQGWRPRDPNYGTCACVDQSEQVVHKPATVTSSTAAMDTHWEEATPPTDRQQHAASTETDDTESELIAIPESDLSDSTLYDSFDELNGGARNGGSPCVPVLPLLLPPTKDTQLHNLLNVSASLPCDGRPTWFIGSEEDSVQVCTYDKIRYDTIRYMQYIFLSHICREHICNSDANRKIIGYPLVYPTI